MNIKPLLLLSILFIFTQSLCAEPSSKIKIGVITVLNGNLASYGTAVQNGFILAHEEEKNSNIEGNNSYLIE